MPIEIRIAASAEMDVVRALFREYADSLDFDLSFQSFDRELADLPGPYAPPKGAVWIAWRGTEPLGCVALRPLSPDAGPDAGPEAGPKVGEVKRLWVRPAGRGRGLGRSLAEALIARARAIGYRSLRLDTVASMGAAIALYESLGFRAISAYCENPVPGALFFERVFDPAEGGE